MPPLYSETHLGLIEGLTADDEHESLANPDEFRTANTNRPGNRLLHFVVGLLASILITCIAAVVCGHIGTVPSTVSAIGLADCDNAPCFRGIVPGRTSWTAAKAVFGNRPVIQLAAFYGVDGEVVLSPFVDNTFLETIVVNLSPSQQITVGDIVALYGAPSGITIYQRTGGLILHYPWLYVVAQSAASPLSPDAPIKSIVFSKALDGVEKSGFDCSTTVLFDVTGTSDLVEHCPWHGFSSLQH